MDNAITSLTTSVTSASLWSSFQGVVPVIAVIVPVALGFYFVRRIINNVSNKGKMKT